MKYLALFVLFFCIIGIAATVCGGCFIPQQEVAWILRLSMSIFLTINTSIRFKRLK